MRRLLPAILACLLLAGCGAPAETAGTTAENSSEALPNSAPAEISETTVKKALENLPEAMESAPAEPLCAPAVMSVGQTPEADCDLPTESVSLYDWPVSGEPLALLAELPERGMALYGVADGEEAPHVLFRWGDTLAEFPDWTIYTSKAVTPELLALDLDGDGALEPVVLCYQGGTQACVYDLHVLQQSDGVLTDYRLPETLYEEQLSALLTLGGSGETLTISLGSQSIEAALPEGVQAETLEHLWTGAFVSWQAEDGTLRLVDQAALPPESSTAISTVYLTALSARVSFSDGQFSLSDFTLQSKLS